MGNFIIKGQKPAGQNKNILQLAGEQLKRFGSWNRERVKKHGTSNNLKKGFY